MGAVPKKSVRDDACQELSVVVQARGESRNDCILMISCLFERLNI